MFEKKLEVLVSLREMKQSPGVSLSLDDQLRLFELCKRLGVNLVEAVQSPACPKDRELFQALAKDPANRSLLVDFSALKHHRSARDGADATLLTMAASPAPIVVLYVKAHPEHVTAALGISLGRNLELLEESVRFLVAHGKRVIVDLEHGSEGLRDAPEYVLQVVQTAVDAGADTIVVCDTRGDVLEHEVFHGVSLLIEHFGKLVQVGFHGHNDLDQATGNTLAAIEAGATHIQTTLLGKGERTGNCDLFTVLAVLQLRMGYRVVSDRVMQSLTPLAHEAALILNCEVPPDTPVVGRAAFAHKGGAHVSSVQRAGSWTYEWTAPENVGNNRDVIISELAGRGSMGYFASDVGLQNRLDQHQLQRIVDVVKMSEARGYDYSSARANVELMMLQEVLPELATFTVQSWELTERGGAPSSATVTVLRNGRQESGHFTTTLGGFHALDGALKLALGDSAYLSQLKLRDYKVRVFDPVEDTGARVRVLAEWDQGDRRFLTTGVSHNQTEAAFEALVVALNLVTYREELKCPLTVRAVNDQSWAV